MSALFLETSALVKRWIAEKGSAWVREQTRPAAAGPMFVARLVGVEVAGALTRAVRGGRLSRAAHGRALAELRADLAVRLEVVEMTPAVMDRAMEIAVAHGLRGADAVHVAAACAIHEARRRTGGEPLTFVSADNEARVAASALGLAVDDPLLHALPLE